MSLLVSSHFITSILTSRKMIFFDIPKCTFTNVSVILTAAHFHLFVCPFRKLLSGTRKNAILKLMKETQTATDHVYAISWLSTNYVDSPYIICISGSILNAHHSIFTILRIEFYPEINCKRINLPRHIPLLATAFW